MEFGNASWGFRETPLEEQLKITREMGLQYLELAIANAPMDLPLDADRAALAEVRELFEKYGVKLQYAATGNDFTTGGQDLEKVKKVVEICASLGVSCLRIFAGFSPVEEVTGFRWDNMIHCIREADQFASARGVSLAIETHGGVRSYEDGVSHFMSVTTLPKALFKMLGELPDRVKVTFDPANLRAVGIERPETVYEACRERVAMIHLKDFMRLPSGHLVPAAYGEGSMDWKSLWAALSDYKGIALFEYENPQDAADGLRRCLDYVGTL